MATRAQIARLAARIAELVQRADDRPAVAYVWRNCGETAEQALERHYADQPQDRAARSTYVFGWRDR